MEPRITFLELPGEIREHIYRELLISDNNYREVEDQDPSTFWTFDLRIYRTCKQIHDEAREVFRRVNIFVKIITPWESAVENTKKFSNTPVLCRGEDAEAFKGCQMTCSVDAPLMPSEHGPHTFVIDARDTIGFCRSVSSYIKVRRKTFDNDSVCGTTLTYPMKDSMDNLACA